MAAHAGTFLALSALVTLSLASQSLHDFTAEDINGDQIALSAYRGKVVLVVNVASE